LYKKAVSPIIAMVLLIALAVSISAMVIVWANSFTRDTTQYVESRSNIQRSCTMDASLSYWKATDGKDDICYKELADSIFIRFKLLNTGDVPITALLMTVINESGDGKTVVINASNYSFFPLQKGYTHEFNVTYSDISGRPVQFKIYPYVYQSESDIVCTDAVLEKDYLVECS